MSSRFAPIITIFLLVIVLPITMSAQTATSESSKQKIKLCPLKLTEIGATTSFRFQYIVRFSTKADGSVNNIQKIRWSGEEKIVNSETVIPCIKTWVLKPQKKYMVLISFGTTTGKNFMIISNVTDKESIEIEL